MHRISTSPVGEHKEVLCSAVGFQVIVKQKQTNEVCHQVSKPVCMNTRCCGVARMRRRRVASYKVPEGSTLMRRRIGLSAVIGVQNIRNLLNTRV